MVVLIAVCDRPELCVAKPTPPAKALASAAVTGFLPDKTAPVAPCAALLAIEARRGLSMPADPTALDTPAPATELTEPIAKDLTSEPTSTLPVVAICIAALTAAFEARVETLGKAIAIDAGIPAATSEATVDP